MQQPINFYVRVHQANLSYGELLTIWQAADALGYHGASLYDLLAAPCLECWTTLATLTAATRRLRAIPMVLAFPYRLPALLAKMAATLDVVSDGRLIVGVGAGGSRQDHEASGIPWRPLQERVDRLEDGIDVMRFLWSGQTGTFTSRYYGTISGPGFPRPAQQPPLLIGGHGERYVLPLVARKADLCNIGFDVTPAAWERYARILERSAHDAGRDPKAIGLTHNATVLVGRNPAAVHALVDALAQKRGVSVDETERRLASALVGTPEQCIARLRTYIDVGIHTFFLLFSDMPSLASLELFAQEVLPAFRSA